MSSFIAAAIPSIVFISHILLGVLVLAFVADKSWRRKIVCFAGENAVLLGFILSLGIATGSLFYSEVLGFEPCVICWWTRVLLFPLVVIFGMALYKKTKTAENAAFLFAVPLAVLAAVVSLYFFYVSLGGFSLLSCTAEGGACSRVYVKAFGYITIPSMALTSAIFVLVLARLKKLYDEDSHA